MNPVSDTPPVPDTDPAPAPVDPTDRFAPYVGKIVLLQLASPLVLPIYDPQAKCVSGAMTKQGPMAVMALTCSVERLTKDDIEVRYGAPDEGMGCSLIPRSMVGPITTHSGPKPAPAVQLVGISGGLTDGAGRPLGRLGLW